VLVLLTVRHPRLPFGVLWLPILSLAVYILAWGMRAALWFVPPRRLSDRVGERLPVEPHRIGRFLTGVAWSLLCSGSYVLCDVAIPEERLAVKIRFV
jgi:hypothetical protein